MTEVGSQLEFPGFDPRGDSLVPERPEAKLDLAEVADFVKELIVERRFQPAPSELIAQLEERFGWLVRLHVKPLIDALRNGDPKVPSFVLEYLRTTLSAEEIDIALRGGNDIRFEHKSTIDDLFKQSRQLRGSSAFTASVEFVAKLRDYAPYNNLLVRIQKPDCAYYATRKDWEAKFDRAPKEDARPLLILAPMHPVMLVYDIDDTEGEALPDMLERFGQAAGRFDEAVLDRTFKNAERDLIQVQFRNLAKLSAGFATTRLNDRSYKMRVVVRQQLDAPSRYLTMCHELAHIYLGHLGSDATRWWPCRINLSHTTVELEAEAVAYIVCVRKGLTTTSAEYLASYLEGGVPDSVSIELITKVADRILNMGEHLIPRRKRKPQPRLI